MVVKTSVGNFLSDQLIYYEEHNNVIEPWDVGSNLVLVSPTGSGKSIIMLRMIDKFLKSNKGSKVLVLCPTNLLTDQLYQSFCRFSKYCCVRIRNNENMKPETITFCTGHKALLCYQKKIWLPQDFALVAYDEVHRMGAPNAPYRQINSLIADSSVQLGFTATLVKKIRSKILNCFKVAGQTTAVSPIKWPRRVCYEKVEFSSRRKLLYQKTKLNLLEKYGSKFKAYNRMDLESVLEEPRRIFVFFSKQRPSGFGFRSILNTQVLRRAFLRHFYFYEDYAVFTDYLERTLKLKNRDVFWPYLKLLAPYENEKFLKIQELVMKSDSTVIIFMDNYTTILELKKYLEQKNFRNVLVLGGKSKLSEKTRKKTLSQIKSYPNSIILTTSVAEEGLDIGSADTVVFFRPVVNEINYIQRVGRTGRHGPGTIAILYYDNTGEAELVNHIKKVYDNPDRNLKEGSISGSPSDT